VARIDFRNMGHSYLPNPSGDGDYALLPMDYSFQDGGAYALLGPSGCGKSTLLNVTSGLLTPSHGQVLFDGKEVTGLQPRERNIAQVFQFPVIYDSMTVADNLAFPLRNRKVDEGTIRKRVAKVADMLEISHLLKRRATNLGADEKQLISMGRGLVREDVSAILFDEPLTVIDPHLKWVLRRKLREIHAEFGHTLVYVTHDQTEALTFADQVVIMTNGKVLQTGSPQDLFEYPRHAFVGYFIGSPGMNFAKCTLDGNVAQLAAGRVELNEALARKASALTGDLELGIRPEMIDLVDKRESDAVPARIVEVQDLGSFRIITAAIGEDRFNIKAPEDYPSRTGDEVGLRFQKNWSLLYCNGELVESKP